MMGQEGDYRVAGEADIRKIRKGGFPSFKKNRAHCRGKDTEEKQSVFEACPGKMGNCPGGRSAFTRMKGTTLDRGKGEEEAFSILNGHHIGRKKRRGEGGFPV